MSESWRSEEASEPVDRALAPPSSDRLWPRLIIGGMLVVVLVNFAFIWIAVSGADDIVPSYIEEER